MNNIILDCAELTKHYHDGIGSINVLDKIDFRVHKGERIAVVGRSGSGKSTLLHLLGGLDKPTSGRVSLNGTDWWSCAEKQRCRMRNQHIGFIYQFHHLLPEFTALENVAMVLLLSNIAVNEAKRRALIILDKVGLSNRSHHKPTQLSGGERQRVAIARALVANPSCVLADEPTGNLDVATATNVFDLMLELNRHLQTAVVVVTHDQSLAAKMHKTITIQDGVFC